MEERGRSGKSVMEHIRFLTVSIGRRPAASRKEERAARYIEESFMAMGLDCHYERFRSRLNDNSPRFVCFTALFLSVLFYRASPLVLYPVFVFFLLMFMFEIMGRSPLGMLQWRRSSGNVWVRIEPYEEVRRTMVIMAPLDNPSLRTRMAVAGRERSRLPYVLLVIINIVLGMWLTLMTGAHLLSVSSEIQRTFWQIALAASFPDLIAALWSVISKAIGRKKGVSENESSHLAALLLLGERFSRRRPARTRIWLVAVGSDSAGGIGVKRFVSRHRKDLKGALYVFLDCMGRDRPLAYKRAGVFLPFKAHKPALKMAESINLRYPHFRLIIGGTSVSMGGFYRLLSSGRHVIALSSRFDRERSREEVARDRVNPAFLRENTNFVAHIIEDYDRESGSRGR